jgi:hypothetical protein
VFDDRRHDRRNRRRPHDHHCRRKTMRHYLVALGLLGWAAAANAQDTSSTTFQTPKGEVTVTSGQPQPRQYGAPPPFADLDRSGRGQIGEEDAAAYPPLANDFIHADLNRDGHVSRSEYQRWAAHQ